MVASDPLREDLAGTRPDGARPAEKMSSEAPWNIFAAAERRKPPRLRAKLWWLLVATFFSLMTTLSVVLTVLWYRNHMRATRELHQVYTAAINGFNETSYEAVDILARRVQVQLVHRVHEEIQDYLGIPERIVAMSVASMTEGMHMLQLSNVSRTLEMLWLQLAETPGVSRVSYADYRGVFAAYRRNVDSTYAAEYRPPDDIALQPLICPTLCPSIGEMQPQLKGDYSVDLSTGQFVQQRGLTMYDPRRMLWYQLATEAHGKMAWTKPFVNSDIESIGIDFVQGLYSTGRTIAVFDASISMFFLSQFLSEFQQTLNHDEYQRRHAVTLIVDKEGLMVASSRGIDQVIIEGPDGQRRRTWREVPGFSVQAALRRLNHTGTALPLPTKGFFGHKADQGKYPSITITYKGGPYLCSYGILTFRGVKLAKAANNWIIVSIVRKKVYLGNVDMTLREVHERVELERLAASQRVARRARTTILLCAFVTLLGGGLMACVARAITMPIRRISKEMRSMAELNFMQKDDAATTPRRKIAKRRRHTVAVFRRGEHGKTYMDSQGSSDESNETSGGSSSSHSGSESEAGQHRRCKPSIPGVTEIIEMREAFACMSSGLQSFAKYIDPHVVELLVRSRKQAELGVQKTEVTIFFSSIANFTYMSEILEPRSLMDLLSEYLEEMSTIIMDHEGVVGEFIGDGIMAWWNTPRNIGERHTATALATALEQQRRLAELRLRWRLRGMPDFWTRMGLTRGTVHAGNVGSRRRMKFGLVGDSVNLASRLEALCKRYSVGVLVDGSVYEAPYVEQGYLCRPLDLVIVKGRSGTTELFEVVSERPAPGPASDAIDFVGAFTEIHTMYRAGKFKDALDALGLYQTRWPQDKPAQMMRERCQELLLHPPGPGWTPVQTLSDK